LAFNYLKKIGIVGSMRKINLPFDSRFILRRIHLGYLGSTSQT
jgi:hypothetical protein